MDATQSSTAYAGVATRAIDGNTDGDYDTGKSCTHTGYSSPQFWMLDMKKIYRIKRASPKLFTTHLSHYEI